MSQPSSSTASTNFYDNSGTLNSVDPSPSLFPSYFLHRSSSSHSLTVPDFYHEPIRRVLSAGDLQCMNGSFSPAESPLLTDISAATGKVRRYSAEERRERIQRYRRKRNQRNFHKKITYACRKTLADSRPRVRGRFARNGEAEHEAEFTESGFRCWKSCDFAGEYGGRDWCIQMQAMFPVSGEENWGSVEDLWAGLGGVFGMDVSSSF